MQWLADCAYVIAKSGKTVVWETPLGLPVAQPYRKTVSFWLPSLLTDYFVQNVFQSRSGEFGIVTYIAVLNPTPLTLNLKSLLP